MAEQNKHRELAAEWREGDVFPQLAWLPQEARVALGALADAEGVTVAFLLEEGAARVLEDRGELPKAD